MEIFMLFVFALFIDVAQLQRCYNFKSMVKGTSTTANSSQNIPIFNNGTAQYKVQSNDKYPNPEGYVDDCYLSLSQS